MKFANPLVSSLAVVALGAAVTCFAGCQRCCSTNAPDGSTETRSSDAKTSAPATQCAEDDCCCEPESRLTLLQKQKAGATVDLRTVKLDGLLKEIAGHKGKLVVVDVWATFCVPCKEGFPHLVALHEKHGKNGLVCMSVTVDEPEVREAALKFLRKQNAGFPNYLLDEEPAVWQDHWNVKAIPAVFLFRDGKQVARFDYDDPDNQFTYADVEKKVVSLLNP